MRIAVNSPVMLPEISSALSVLTSGARIRLADIRQDLAEGIVEIIMKQRELIEPTKSFWGRPIFHGQAWVDAKLTIRQVLTMKMDVDDLLVTDCDSCFTVMMGLKMSNDEVYLGSLEESKGKTLCQVSIKVKEIDLEFSDRMKTE